MEMNLEETGSSGDTTWITGERDLLDEIESRRTEVGYESFRKHFLALGYNEVIVNAYATYLNKLVASPRR